MELPSITKAFYVSNTANLGDVMGGGCVPTTSGSISSTQWGNAPDYQEIFQDAMDKHEGRTRRTRRFNAKMEPQQAITLNLEKAVATTARRIVQVFIVDPDENVPLDKALLYQGEVKMTDLTDQELFFEIDIKKILDAHNETRKGIVNKTVKERTEYLEPARIRDLKMTVVDIATF